MRGHLRAAIKSRWSISVLRKLFICKENIQSEAKWQENDEKAMDRFCASDFVQLQISAPDLDFGLAQQSNTKTMYLSVLAWKLHSHTPCIARPGLPGLKTKLNWYALTLNLALTWIHNHFICKTDIFQCHLVPIHVNDATEASRVVRRWVHSASDSSRKTRFPGPGICIFQFSGMSPFEW